MNQICLCTGYQNRAGPSMADNNQFKGDWRMMGVLFNSIYLSCVK